MTGKLRSPWLRDLLFIWPVMMIFVVAGLLWANLGDLLDTLGWVDHTDQVIAQVYEVESLAVDMQTGFRGYLYTGRENFLEPFTRGRHALVPALNELRDLTRDNPAQQARVGELADAVESWEEYATGILAMKAAGRNPVAIVREGHGEERMGAIRGKVAELDSAERSLRQQRFSAAQRSSRRALDFGVVALGLLILIALRGFYRRKRFEAELSVWKRMIEAAEWGAAVGSPEGKLLIMNRAFARIFGFAPEELSGQSLATLWTPEESARMPGILAEIHEKGHLVFEIMAVRKSGARFPLLVDSTAVKDPQGRVRYRVTHVRDLTEQKQAQQKLARSEKLFSQIFENIHAGIWILDAEGRIVRGNSAALSLWGGLRQTDPAHYGDYKGWFYDTGEALKAEDWGGYAAVTEGRVVIGQLIQIETWDRRQRVILNSAFPLRDEDGKITGAIVVNEDITALKRAEARQKFLADASQSISESLSFNDILGQIAQLGVRELADWCMVDVTTPDGGLRRELVVAGDAARQQTADAIKREFSTPASDYVALAVRTGQPQRTTGVTPEWFRGNVRNARYRELLLGMGVRSFIITPLRARGRTLGAISWVATQADFTEEDVVFAQSIADRAAVAADNAYLFEREQRAVKAREDTLAIVSHDLKNPIAAVDLSARLIERQCPGREDIGRLTENIRKSTSQALDLISDLLDAARVEAGTLEVSATPQEARALLAGAVELLRPLALNRAIDLRAQEEQEGLVVLCEKRRIAQGLSNLVGNAIKFAPRESTIVVGVRAQGGARAVFYVRDEGPGIPEEARSRIFDRFYQPAATRRQGTGLGLAIAKGIIEAHGGQIWFETAPGGTTFYFSLPLAPAEVADLRPAIRR